jgi:hypothetical protein
MGFTRIIDIKINLKKRHQQFENRPAASTGQLSPALGAQRKGPEISRPKGRHMICFQGWHELTKALISGGGFRFASKARSII